MFEFNDIVDFFEGNYWPLWLAGLGLFVLVAKKFYFNGCTCHNKRRLENRTCIVTGASSGHGQALATELAKRGARVIMACRNIQKAIDIRDKIREKTGNKNVIVEHLDLASLRSVREFAGRINKSEERLDVLVNNAGIMAVPKQRTEDGFDMQFQVNFLGHFLLTNLLLEKLKRSAPSRILNVSALAYEYGCRDGSLDLNDLNSEKCYEPWKVYKQTKICMILFTLALNKRLANTGVTVNALHPGLMRTNLLRYYPKTYGWSDWSWTFIRYISYPFIWWTLKSPEQAAQVATYCVVSEKLEEVSGKYISDCRERKLLPEVNDMNKAERLWEQCSEMARL